MSSSQRTPNQSILLAFGVYLALCAVSAFFAPISWLWAAGLGTTVSQEIGLLLGVLGAYLGALALGAFLAARNPSTHTGVIYVLLASQVFDFLVTLRAVYGGALPRVPGTIFLVATVIWSTLLALSIRLVHSRTSEQRFAGNS